MIKSHNAGDSLYIIQVYYRRFDKYILFIAYFKKNQSVSKIYHQTLKYDLNIIPYYWLKRAFLRGCTKSKTKVLLHKFGTVVIVVLMFVLLKTTLLKFCSQLAVVIWKDCPADSSRLTTHKYYSMREREREREREFVYFIQGQLVAQVYQHFSE